MSPTAAALAARSAQRSALLDRVLELQVLLRRRLEDGLTSRLRDEVRAQITGITAHQLDVLIRLADDAPMTMRHFAETMGIGGGGATRLVDRLVASGLVRREIDPDDRRVIRVALAPRARELVARCRSGQRARFAEVAAALDDEQLATFIHLAEMLALSGRAVPAA